MESCDPNPKLDLLQLYGLSIGDVVKLLIEDKLGYRGIKDSTSVGLHVMLHDMI